MPKKLFTVAWSYTVEMEVPEYVTNDLARFNDGNSSSLIQSIASNVIRDASLNINWKDGVITDVQDI